MEASVLLPRFVDKVLPKDARCYALPESGEIAGTDDAGGDTPQAAEKTNKANPSSRIRGFSGGPLIVYQ